MLFMAMFSVVKHSTYFKACSQSTSLVCACVCIRRNVWVVWVWVFVCTSTYATDVFRCPQLCTCSLALSVCLFFELERTHTHTHSGNIHTLETSMYDIRKNTHTRRITKYNTPRQCAYNIQCSLAFAHIWGTTTKCMPEYAILNRACCARAQPKTQTMAI